MTVTQFNHGYWYAVDLKRFAKAIGIHTVSALRKDELEHAIKAFLRTGALVQPRLMNASGSVSRDVDRGLHVDLPVVRYTNDPVTKQFLENEARKLQPGFKRRSGARYRLNRWREGQIRNGVRILYRDLVKEYVRLNQMDRFARVPHGRYINFMSDFLTARSGATREQARKAWAELKTMDIPKTYAAWTRRASHRSPRLAKSV